jgi:hypothetical protein
MEATNNNSGLAQRLTEAAQREAETRPVDGKGSAARRDKLNNELKRGVSFNLLRLRAYFKGWTREQLDEEVKRLGIN